MGIDKGAASNKLLAAAVNFIETQDCDNSLKMYRNRNWQGIRSHQLCAGKVEGGVDTCQVKNKINVILPLISLLYIQFTLDIYIYIY